MKRKENNNKDKKSKIRDFFSSLADNTPKLNRKDWIIIEVLVIFYLII